MTGATPSIAVERSTEIRRRTLARPAPIEGGAAGVGLFTAANVRVTIHPANAGGGIVFRRLDLPGGSDIPAIIDRTLDHAALPGVPAAAVRNTSLVSADGRATVLTVEHVLSALIGLGITDARIDVDGPELPIGDGSALPFAEAIVRAGVVILDGSLRPLVLTERIEVGDERSGASIVAEPLPPPAAAQLDAGAPAGFAPAFAQYRYELDYSVGPPSSSHPRDRKDETGATTGGGASSPSAAIPPQSASLGLPSDRYLQDIAPARTFCTLAEARTMHATGLFRHLSPRDMLVIGPDGPIDNVLRFPDEPARHKLLDLIGDLALVGRPIVGRIIARRSGHALARELARRLVRGGPTLRVGS